MGAAEGQAKGGGSGQEPGTDWENACVSHPAGAGLVEAVSGRVTVSVLIFVGLGIHVSMMRLARTL